MRVKALRALIVLVARPHGVSGIGANTSIPAGGYLVFYENKHFGNRNDPGCRQPFALSRDGETVYLHSGSGGVLSGYSEQEKFDASEAGCLWAAGPDRSSRVRQRSHELACKTALAGSRKSLIRE